MLLVCVRIIFTLGNNVPATLGNKLGVTFDDDRSLMRLDGVVIAGWNNSFILLIALLRLVPCLESTTGWLVLEGVYLCFRSSSAADRRLMESVFGSLLLAGKKLTQLLSWAFFVAVTYTL